ncbi:hypothetical protein [Novosphingobium sp. MBES04]|uniref:hypothetical protein n=1 Tax=Novosphingobium sp. MBES04 TaxID=1206458 RepID=UPI0005806A40|nr:hypothetical protein [Novosphingobium sp. MBES04]GAM03905.1 hypothetical conserved protein [Novosphingobium sp. MBES04]
MILRQGALAVPLAALLALVLAGCGQADSEPGPGGVTVGEARALDAAAKMLDERQVPSEALVPSGMAAPVPSEAAPR